MNKWSGFGVAALVVAVTMATGCGKTDDGGGADGDKVAAGTSTHLPLESAPFAYAIEQAGFKPVAYQLAPAQVPGRTTSFVTYQGTSNGGVIYSARDAAGVDRVIWHWYFSNMKPDSALCVELSDDGLWDTRIYFAGGETRDYIQDRDFSFVGKERSDMVAMNGSASPGEGITHAFDGDANTIWGSENEASVQLLAPFKIEAGVLTVQLGKNRQPKTVVVEAGGKKVAELELEATSTPQEFQLGEDVRGADSVKLTFRNPRGEGVGVTGIELR